MAGPEVTIISVSRNEGAAIRPTIESVLSQTYDDFEYIIKDGASTDDTVKIAEEYSERFKKRGIDYKIVSAPDKGIYDAMNTGVALSKGRWINFMNAGDCFYGKDTLKNIFSGREPEEAQLLYGDAIEEEYGEFYYFRKCPELIAERMPFSHQSVFARRELLEEFPFDLKYRIAADYDFLLRAYKKGAVFKDSRETVAVVSKSGVSSVRLKDTYLESLRLREDRGIPQPSGAELKRKLWILELKQFGMDHFPDWVKYCIRKVQRWLRHQRKAEYKRGQS